jgi:hypothetical protein
MAVAALPATLLMFGRLSAGAESRWNRLRSANFEIYSSANPRAARDTIRYFEQVRGFFVQAFGGDEAKPLPVRLVTFGSDKEYQPYRLNEFAIAYYQPTPSRDYIVMSHGGADIFPVAVHEYVHLLTQHTGLKLPPWANEGLAEVYSTLRPSGDKILIGSLIPGRHQALLNEKWVPLTVILEAGRDSPYYNEKNKAGSLYNEGWALTHMLCFRPEYRSKFGELIRTISAGEDSVQALSKVYGKSVPQLEKELQSYLRGSSFQGVVVPAKIEKITGDIPAEPLAEFDTELMLVDLLNRRETAATVRPRLEQLIQMDASRPEPHQDLGYLAWRNGPHDEALKEFGKAYELGGREPRFLWDYGRMLESARDARAIEVLKTLLATDATRTDVRLELADELLRGRDAKGSLEMLNGFKTMTHEEAARFFRIAVYAYLMNGDPQHAMSTAAHYRDIAKTDKERADADMLSSVAAPRQAKAAAPPPATPGNDRPLTRRPVPVRNESTPAPPPPLPSISGRFVELECRGQQARMILETGTGRKVFLIADAGKVVILSGGEGTVDMVCGKQKNPVNVRVEYTEPASNQAGVDGLVATLAF